ncbi:hypothetical protein STEG23_036681, partial [Scotinomys teguina]
MININYSPGTSCTTGIVLLSPTPPNSGDDSCKDSERASQRRLSSLASQCQQLFLVLTSSSIDINFIRPGESQRRRVESQLDRIRVHIRVLQTQAEQTSAQSVHILCWGEVGTTLADPELLSGSNNKQGKVMGQGGQETDSNSTLT